VSLRNKVSIVPDLALTMTQAHVTLNFKDGSEITAYHDAGIPEHNLERLSARLRAKFIALTSPACGEAEAEQIAEAALAFSSQREADDLVARATVAGPKATLSGKLLE
jgi:hypothetical protein